MNLQTYFDAPVFASQKSTRLLRWRSELEKRLMIFFDGDSRIADYFQPQMTTVVKHDNREFEVEIDFWLEYSNGKIILIHIERKKEMPLKTAERVLPQAKLQLKADGFDFLVVGEGEKKPVVTPAVAVRDI